MKRNPRPKKWIPRPLTKINFEPKGDRKTRFLIVVPDKTQDPYSKPGSIRFEVRENASHFLSAARKIVAVTEGRLGWLTDGVSGTISCPEYRPVLRLLFRGNESVVAGALRHLRKEEEGS